MMRKSSVLILRLSFLLFILLMLSKQSSAYNNGIEEGDVVNLDYTLTYDGKVQQEGPGFQTQVSPKDLIEGFYEGLLGMKVGERKEIVVPPEKGYQEPHELAGKTLYFDVYINGIIDDVREGKNAITNEGGIGTTLKKIGTGIMVVGGAGITFFGVQSLRKVTIPRCDHCTLIGKSVASEGFCGGCGGHYCRNSFLKGCPNCKANTFKPL